MKITATNLKSNVTTIFNVKKKDNKIIALLSYHYD